MKGLHLVRLNSSRLQKETPIALRTTRPMDDPASILADSPGAHSAAPEPVLTPPPTDPSSDTSAPQPRRPHAMAPHAFEPRTVTVSEASVGTIQIAPPSFLERWGVIFLAVFGIWIVLVGTIILVYFLWRQPLPPTLAGLSGDQLQTTLAAHKALSDQWRDNLNYIFDLLVTKTALPLVTLLLGYLFGKGRPGA